MIKKIIWHFLIALSGEDFIKEYKQLARKISPAPDESVIEVDLFSGRSNIFLPLK